MHCPVDIPFHGWGHRIQSNLNCCKLFWILCPSILITVPPVDIREVYFPLEGVIGCFDDCVMESREYL